nr:armadillo-type fold [Tanacetum cinerariifolium]
MPNWCVPIKQRDQIAFLPCHVTAHVKHLNQKGKRKVDFSPTQENKSNPPKSCLGLKWMRHENLSEITSKCQPA